MGVTVETATGFDKVLTSKEAWILLLGIIMLPVVLKKELQELHIVSVSLFVSMITFICSLFIQLCTYGTAKFPVLAQKEEVNLENSLTPLHNAEIHDIISCVSVLILAFSFTINLFPIYSGLKVKTNENCNQATKYAMYVIAFVYSFMGFVCVLLFGESI